MYVNGVREAKDTTKTRQNTQDPMWNHQAVFEINRENPKLLGHVFVFRIFHKDMMMGVQEIGQVIFFFLKLICLCKVVSLFCYIPCIAYFDWGTFRELRCHTPLILLKIKCSR